jgi:Homeodomain-like domain
MRRTGKSKICVWRWQERFMQAGYDGLLRDKTRPSRIPPLGSDIAKRVVALTRTDPPAETTHWTATMMAKAVGISARFRPTHLAHAWSPAAPGPPVQAFQRPGSSSTSCAMLSGFMSIRPPMPSPLGRRKVANPGARPHPTRPADEEGPSRHDDHDYKRHGTTTLSAALDVLESKVIGRCMQRHRHQEFIRFLNAIEAQVPAKKSRYSESPRVLISGVFPKSTKALAEDRG